MRTPVYHVFDMYKGHMGAKQVPIALPSGLRNVHEISASASVAGKKMTVTLTNPSVDAARTVRVRIAGVLRPSEVLGRVLTHPAMNAANTFDRPDEVHPVSLDANVTGDSITVSLPPKSTAALTVRLT